MGLSIKVMNIFESMSNFWENKKTPEEERSERIKELKKQQEIILGWLTPGTDVVRLREINRQVQEIEAEIERLKKENI